MENYIHMVICIIKTVAALSVYPCVSLHVRCGELLKEILN